MSKFSINPLRRALDQVHEALGREVARQMLEEDQQAKPQPQLLDETTKPVRVLAFPSQPVEITWLDTHGHVFKVETRTFEP